VRRIFPRRPCNTEIHPSATEAIMSATHLSDPAFDSPRKATLRPATMRHVARRTVELGASVALGVLAVGLVLAARLAFAAHTWQDLHAALHRLASIVF
jgi:hypothetical protein